MQMAKGADIIKGTIAPTTTNDTINFGKSFNRYIAFFEMDDASKEKLADNWSSGTRSFGCVGVWWGGCNDFNDAKIVYTERYVGSRKPSNGFNAIGGYVKQMNSDNIVLDVGTLESGVSYFYVGYTYNYIILPIE